MSSNSKRRLSRLAVLCLIPVLGAMLLSVSWNLYWRVPGHIDMFLHRSEYEKVVEAMKARPAPAARDTDSVTFGAIRATAIRDAAGLYSITLETADWGHFGASGYLFTDGAPTPIVGDPYTDVAAPGDLWMLGKQVAPHWWTLSNHLR